MRKPIPRSKSFPDVWNALVLQAMRETWHEDNHDNDDFWNYCCEQLQNAGAWHARRAAEAIGFARKMRHAETARLCEHVAHPDADGVDELFATAQGTLAKARDVHGQGRAFLLAETRLCLLLGDIDLARVGLTHGEYLELLGEPVPAEEDLVHA